MDLLRRTYRRPELPLEAAEQASQLVAPDLREEVRLLIDQLPDPYRDVLILKYVNGLDTNEVATIMKKSSQATNSMLQRARQSLKELGIAEIPGLARGAHS